jgi:hypothetical protein
MYSLFQAVASAEVLAGEGPGEAGQVEEDLLTKKCWTIQATRFNMNVSTAQEVASTELGANILSMKLHQFCHVPKTS